MLGKVLNKLTEIMANMAVGTVCLTIIAIPLLIIITGAIAYVILITIHITGDGIISEVFGPRTGCKTNPSDD